MQSMLRISLEIIVAHVVVAGQRFFNVAPKKSPLPMLLKVP